MIESYIRTILENNNIFSKIIKDIITDYAVINAKSALLNDAEKKLSQFNVKAHEHGSYFTLNGQKIAKVSYSIGKAPIIQFANDSVILKQLNQ